MIPGFNHNIQRQGHTYHIQTEDSGLDNPHIITLLYLNGTIISKKKTSYADILKVDRLPEVVRELMQEQHKSMLRQLVNGQFEDSVNQILPAQPKVSSPEPKNETVPSRAANPESAANPGTLASPLPASQADAPEISAAEIGSLFGNSDDPGEKSLDEIILGYLTEESK